MKRIRSNQGSQQVIGVVQPRPTFAEKVRRLQAAPLLGLSNRPTSSNLTPHTRPRTPAYMRARARPCVCILGRQVRRLDSGLIVRVFLRPTSPQKVRRMKGGWS